MRGIIMQTKKGAWISEKEKNDSSVSAGDSGGRQICRTGRTKRRTFRELELFRFISFPMDVLPDGKKEDGGEPHTLYLPKKDGISYQYEESRKTGEDDGGIKLTYQYGETVRSGLWKKKEKQEGRPCLEGETCCLLSGEKTALTATMRLDEDIEVSFIKGDAEPAFYGGGGQSGRPCDPCHGKRTGK